MQTDWVGDGSAEKAVLSVLEMTSDTGSDGKSWGYQGTSQRHYHHLARKPETVNHLHFNNDAQ